MAKNTQVFSESDEREAEAGYAHVIKYTGLFGGVQGLTMLVAVVRNKLVSIFLGPSGLALINLFNNAVRLVGQATNFGLPFSAVKHVAELSDTKAEVQGYVRTVRTWCLCVGLLGVLVCLALSRQLSVWTFENEEYVPHFMLLSLSVGMLTMQGGEMAILKGLKQLGRVALVSVFGALFALAICTVIYVFWRSAEGIVCSLVLCQAAVLAVHLHYSTKAVPWQVSLFSKDVYSKGLPMLKLGVGYILAGVFGQGAEYVIRKLILNFGTLEDVGLYSCGYTLVVSYANVVFVAFDSDYFPRLSVAQQHRDTMNRTINQQMEVSVLMMAPLLSLFVLFMPLLVPLLFSNRFVEAVPMAVCAASYMLFKSFSLPVAYLALAKGDSRMYMLTELLYDVFIAVAVPFAFRLWGLEGAGWALSVAGFLNLITVSVAYGIAYGYRFDVRMFKPLFLQVLCFAFVVFSALQSQWWLKGVSVAVLVISFAISFSILKRQTQVVERIKEKWPLFKAKGKWKK